ncbi:MAG: amidohydrolase [Alcaligenaceae bacterium]|nr:amidohydrolase [Alcaligenaceae bacterium]
MDPAIPSASAVAVADGKILSVGSLDQLKPWLDKYPHEINQQFADKILYPGFVEAHGHPLLGGITQTSLPLTAQPLPNPWGPAFSGVADLAAAIAKLKEYSAAIKDPAEPLLSWGYDIAAMGEIPDRKMLDQVSNTRAILVWDSSEHNFFLNSAALAKYGVTAEAIKNMIGAGFEKDGSSNGQFLGAVASQYVNEVAGKDLLNPEKLPTAMLYSNDLAQQNGITSYSEMTFGILNIALETAIFKKISESNATSLRLFPVAHADSFTAKYGAQAVAEVQKLKTLNTDRLMFNGVKFIGDDAYLANTMMLQNPSYTDWHKGLIFYATPADYAKAMLPWWKAGFQIHLHTNGNAGIANTLSALQLLQDEKPRFDHRFTLQHFGLPTSMNVKKVKALGAVVSVNPAYFYTRAGIQAKDVGHDRVSYATRVGDLVREGVVVSLHSDNPVAPPMPLTEVWAVVNRLNLYTGDQKWAPAQAITVQQAMRMVTIDAAYTLGQEDLIGSIEPGKFADFAVLDDDPMTVDSIKIKDIPVVATILGGRIILVSETKKPRPL